MFLIDPEVDPSGVGGRVLFKHRLAECPAASPGGQADLFGGPAPLEPAQARMFNPATRLSRDFPAATRGWVEPRLPQALAEVERIAGRRLSFPSPVEAMDPWEVAKGRALRGPGHEEGAGNGLWDPVTRTAKVNRDLPPPEVLLNVVHEYLHMALPGLVGARGRSPNGCRAASAAEPQRARPRRSPSKRRRLGRWRSGGASPGRSGA